jgi:mannosyltransferase
MMTDPPASPTHRQLAILTLILAVAALIRVYRLATPSLWTDELWSIEMAMGRGSVHDAFPAGVIRFDQPIATSLASAAPWWHIWNHVQVITHPPIYYILLRWWIDFFGNSPAAARSLSVLFSLVAIAVFFDLCRLLHGPKFALMASAIFALAVGQIDIAQEARSYALVTLEEIAACDLLARIALLGPNARRIVLLAFLLAAMFLTHYLSAAVILALAIFSIAALRKSARLLTLDAFAAAALIVLAAWGYEFRDQLRTIPFADPTYFHEIFPHHIANSFVRIVRLPLQYLYGEDLGLRLPLWSHIIASIAIAILVIRGFRHRDLRLWSILFTVTIAFVAAIDLTRDDTLLQYSRYTILAAPALYALLANIPWPKNSIYGPLIILISLVIIVAAQMLRPPVPRQDFQQLAETIDSRAAADELLVFYNQSDWLSPGMWYIGYKYYSPASTHPWLTLRQPPDARLLHKLSGRHILWLIGRSPEKFGPIIFPGWYPVQTWHTTAGGVCLMEK